MSNSNVRLGDEAVERVMALLHSKMYETYKIYTNKFSPDLKCIVRITEYSTILDDKYTLDRTKISTYGVEVKSLKGVSGGKIGRVTIDIDEWKGLLKWCIKNVALPYVIFEIKGGRARYLYRFINGDIITEKMRGNGLSLTVWQILKYGKEDFE